MKYLSFYLIIGILITIPGCEAIDDSPCGQYNTYDLYLLGPAAFENTGTKLSTYMEGNNRVLRWGELVEDVCTDEHVNVSFRAAFREENAAAENYITARGKVSWQLLYQEETLLTKNGSDLKGNLEVGLKNAFADLHGWFSPTLELVFPTKGSYTEDTIFMKEHLISIEIMAKHRVYKL